MVGNSFDITKYFCFMIKYKKEKVMIMSKKKDARHVQIRNILQEKEELRVKELAEMLEVTPETLRKDLDELETKGIVIRYHGYVRKNKSSIELPIAIRNQENVDTKRRLMFRAIEEIEDGNIVYLDAGSTMIAGIDGLIRKKDLTIITNSLLVAQRCDEMNFDVVLIGGKLTKHGLHTEGYFSEKMLDSMHIDIAILGTDGILNSNGFTVYTMEEVGTRRHVINQSRKIMVVSEEKKFAKSAYYSFCSFREVDLFVTNELNAQEMQQVQACKKIIQVKK